MKIKEIELMLDDIDELNSLIPSSMKELHKEAILTGRSFYVISKDGVTPINQGEVLRSPLNEKA